MERRRTRRCAFAVEAVNASSKSTTDTREAHRFTTHSRGQGCRLIGNGTEKCKSGGHTGSAGVAVAGVGFEPRAAARAVARGAAQSLSAFGAERSVGLGARTVGGAWSTEHGARSSWERTAPCSLLPAHGNQRFAGVFGFQRIVILIRKLSSGAVEFDFLERPERHRAGTHVVVRILALIADTRIGRRLRRRPKNREQYVVRRARREQHGGDHDRNGGNEVPREIEATLGRRHERRFAVLRHELVNDLLRRLPLPREPQHVLVQRRAVGAAEVGRAAGVDVEPAAAAAAQPLLDRLNAGIVVRGGDGRERAAGATRIVDAAGTRRVLNDGAGRGCRERGDPAPADGMVHWSAGSSFTAYPACTRDVPDPLTATGPPPGHSTINPPITSTNPPNHTHQTSGLMVKRYTACSVPFTRPPSTTYRSSRSPLLMPTSVEGSKVGRPSASTCWRFSVRNRPIGLPSRRTSTSAAVTSRLRALYCEIPRCVKVYTWP